MFTHLVSSLLNFIGPSHKREKISQKSSDIHNALEGRVTNLKKNSEPRDINTLFKKTVQEIKKNNNVESSYWQETDKQIEDLKDSSDRMDETVAALYQQKFPWNG